MSAKSYDRYEDDIEEEPGLSTAEIYERALVEGAPWLARLAGGLEGEVSRSTRIRAYLAISKLLNELGKRDAAGVDGKKGTDSKRIQDEAAARVAAGFEAGED